MKKKCIKVKRGFSLLEVLVALFVLVLGILGALLMVSDSLKNANNSRDIISASQLSQEGIELVRWIRDNNIAKKLEYFNGIGSSSDGCVVDFRIAAAGSSLTCNNAFTSNSYLLYYNDGGSGSGFLSYNHTTGGIATKFKRKLVISGVDPDERLVTSYVFWGGDWSSSAPVNKEECYLAKNCVYTIGKITNWGQD